MARKSFLHGQAGEDQATAYLRQHSYKVIDRNVRTPRYEIDIIAKRKRVIYFVEVKYRSSSDQGYGYDYITDQKLQQMRFAAESWVAEQGYSGNYQLAVVSIDDTDITLNTDLWL